MIPKSLNLYKIFPFFIFLNFYVVNGAQAEGFVKLPNVSGQFYDGNPVKLGLQLQYFHKKAQIKPLKNRVNILIAPHAGYYYSGQTAAYGFKAVSQQKINTVIILAPSHHLKFNQISVWPKGKFKTPFGEVVVNEKLASELIDSYDQIIYEPKAFDKEHSLEVELPFIQKTFPKADIVPIIFGQPSFEVLSGFAGELNDLIGDRDDVLIVVSTDMSHYHDDAFARTMDRTTFDAIEALDAAGIWRGVYAKKMEMCGFIPTVAALIYANELGLNKAEVLHYSNSSDATGDKTRVVGYPAVVIYKDKKVVLNKPENISFEQKRRLIDIARSTIAEYVNTGKILLFDEKDPRLSLEEGAFVTIHKNKRLRGCIGNIIGKGPLHKTVRNMAISAASQDHRFAPVSVAELNEIDVEVSVLTKPKRIKNVDEIIMGTHGVIVSKGLFNRGVFLPQVATETHWSKEEFLNQLCSQKAKLPANCWKDPSVIIEIFTAEVFSEGDVK